MKLTAIDRRDTTPSVAMSRVRVRLNHPPIGSDREEIAELTQACIERVGGVIDLARLLNTSGRSVRNWRDGVYRPSDRFLDAMAEMMGEAPPGAKPVNGWHIDPATVKCYVERGAKLAGSYRKLAMALGVSASGPSYWARGKRVPSPESWQALTKYVGKGVAA